MSYRKITVNNKVYSWTVGKSFLKIKDIGIYVLPDKKEISVTPAIVRKLIEVKTVVDI